jgi:HAD superfamily hydrolase (TIGR01509 family)
LVIFDCDGVIVDSEPLAAVVLGEMLAELGLPAKDDEVLERFNGRKVAEWVGEIEKELQRPIADWFIPEFRRRSAEKFSTELTSVPGIEKVLAALPIPYCLASSGPMEKIELTLGLTGLRHFFEGRIFSGYEVGSWKPDPDLFLHAASFFNTVPQQCVVIEDSLAGIQAGLTAGMTVFHYQPKISRPVSVHSKLLSFNSMAQLQGLLGI